MTAFVAADIPSSIVTVEQLVAWGTRILQRNNPALLITEVAGSSPELQISSNPFPVLADPSDFHTRLVSRVSFRLASNWDTKKLWLGVQEFSVTAIPADLRGSAAV